jgi:3',5'-cyclic AMP phosphodiesterase CpdA
MKVTVSSPSGWSTTVSDDCDFTVPGRGTANQTLTTTVDAGPDPATRWRLTVRTVDERGKASEINALEADLRLPALASTATAVMVGAGDIARCDTNSTAATAQLLARIPGTVFTLGDNVYPTSTPELLGTCYEQTWGRERFRTLATPGNHDWEQADGQPYFSYFGASAGPSGLGYYSYTLGSWHILSLNSNIPAGPGSPQFEWLKTDLAQSGASCKLAMWHHPLFSSGPNGNSSQMRDAWRLLHRFGADIVLNGHDHEYERFAPQDADGHATPTGIREFVVGTGGYTLYERASQQPNSELFENHTWGVMKLTLKTGSYDWEFVPINGQSFRDFGSGQCDSPRASAR